MLKRENIYRRSSVKRKKVEKSNEKPRSTNKFGNNSHPVAMSKKTLLPTGRKRRANKLLKMAWNNCYGRIFTTGHEEKPPTHLRTTKSCNYQIRAVDCKSNAWKSKTLYAILKEKASLSDSHYLLCSLEFKVSHSSKKNTMLNLILFQGLTEKYEMTK